jgi:hypothetical protein
MLNLPHESVQITSFLISGFTSLSKMFQMKAARPCGGVVKRNLSQIRPPVSKLKVLSDADANAAPTKRLN